MHKALLYGAFGWLMFFGTMHLIIDVVSPYLRGKRAPGAETTLFYGLHASFSLGLLTFAALCLWLTWNAPGIVDAWPVMALAIVAAIAWLWITIVFMDFWEPKMSAGVFAVLLVAAALTA